MIGGIPKFTESQYYKSHKGWEYLEEGASKEDKDEYEEYFNDEYSQRDYMDMHPEMIRPFRKWNGEIVDLGEE